ncbi:MAG: hypothetical protein ABI700_16540, partial [Chloroflexota bacterium]
MIIRLRSTWLAVFLLVVLALGITSVAAQTTPLPPLSDPGAYTVGWRATTFTDPNRDGRSLIVYIWYPAIAPATPSTQQTRTQKLGYGWRDADFDAQAAPYPLILFSPAFGGGNRRELEVPLASQGFVVVGIERLPGDDQQNTLIDRPLDMLFVLDQLTATNQSDFGGLIDTDHVGVLGTSFGAYTTLALTGARFDPASANALDTSELRLSFADWNWDKLAAYRATFSPSLTGDGLWPPFSDPRIHAALAISPCLEPIFGTDG